MFWHLFLLYTFTLHYTLLKGSLLIIPQGGPIQNPCMTEIDLNIKEQLRALVTLLRCHSGCPAAETIQFPW